MTANSPRARKTKGQKFQKKIVKLLRNHFNIDNNIIDCFDGDVQAALMGQSGIDIKLSPKAKEIIPFDIECKRQEKLNIWKALAQCEGNATGERIPLLVFKRNHSETYACLEINCLLNLIKEVHR